MDLITPFLVGLLVGAASICTAIVRYIDIRKLKQATEERVADETWKTLAFLAAAEVTRLRVSIAAGDLTEDGKKPDAMTVAALDAVLARRRDELREIRASRIPQQ